MRAKGWAHTRVAAPLDRPHAAEVAGDGRTRLRIRPDRARLAAPIRGALSYPAVWTDGRWRGEAVLTVIPEWSWGYELDLTVSAPDSPLGRIRWTSHRLGRLAASLADALRDGAENWARAARPQHSQIKRPAVSSGRQPASPWSAATTSASR